MSKGQRSLSESYNLLGLESNLEFSFENLVEVLKLHPHSLKYIPKKYQTKKLLKNVSLFSLPFAHVNHSLLTDDQILTFLEYKGCNYRYLSNVKKKNMDYILKALSVDGEVLKEIPDSVTQTKEMVEIAYNQTKKCFYSIKGKNLTQAMLNEYIKICPNEFSWLKSNSDIPVELRTNDEFIRLAIMHGSDNISYVDQTVDLCILSLENHDDSYECIKIVDNPSKEITLKNLLNKKKLMELMSI